ncbi:MAG: NADPH:quinone reductase [Claussenomyces sp. TS43310]|nr:MAG: NADPH:quinone reductase [Claussenomyces sp. TS43310]
MAPIPKTMRGILIEKTGGVEVLQYRTNLPVPSLKEGEVLVKNDYVGINYIDTYFRTGLYPAPKPEILGREAEGTIVAVSDAGETHGFKPDDRAVWMSTAGYAEYTAVPADKAYAIPAGIQPGVAAAALLQGLTALTLIREAYAAQKGDWILVHAAAGGVGLWLCQLLRAVGARVIGTASTPDKIALARANGAEFVIDYSHEDVVARVSDITGGAGVVAVFDGVGKDTFEADLQLLARKGSLVSFGNASGPVPPFAIARLGAKNLKVLRPSLYNYIYTRDEAERYTAELFDLILKDAVEVRVHHVYPLADVATAHSDLEGRRTTGKLLLKT